MLDVGAIILLVLITLAATGFILLVLGIRGRLVDDHPYCAACGFDLSASGHAINRTLRKVDVQPGSGQSERAICPECGGRLTPRASLRIGRRVRRPRLITAGLFLIFATIGGLVASVPNGRVQRAAVLNTPDAWVARLGASDSSYAYRDELLRRIESGTMPSELLRKLAARCVEENIDPASMSYFHRQPLISALMNAGAFQTGDVLKILGEPEVRIRVLSRDYFVSPPSVVAEVVFKTGLAPKGLALIPENIRGTMVEHVDGDERTIDLHSPSTNAIRNFSIDTIESWVECPVIVADGAAPRAYKEFTVARRTYDVQMDLVVVHKQVEILRLKGVAGQGVQHLIGPMKPTVFLDMDEKVNAEARSCYDRLTVGRASQDRNQMAQLVVRWPYTHAVARHSYTMTVRPAGKPDQDALIVQSLPARSLEKVGGTWYCTVRSDARVGPSLDAVDIVFEPVLTTGNLWPYEVSGLPGVAFTIQSIPIR